VVTEALKWFWHRGRHAGLNFYRDSGGNEIDLLLELVNGVFPIEIKAGETVNADFFRGLRAFARLYDPAPPNGDGLVYGSDRTQIQHRTTVVTFGRTHDLIQSVANG